MWIDSYHRGWYALWGRSSNVLPSVASFIVRGVRFCIRRSLQVSRRLLFTLNGVRLIARKSYRGSRTGQTCRGCKSISGLCPCRQDKPVTPASGGRTKQFWMCLKVQIGRAEETWKEAWGPRCHVGLCDAGTLHLDMNNALTGQCPLSQQMVSGVCSWNGSLDDGYSRQQLLPTCGHQRGQAIAER